MRHQDTPELFGVGIGHGTAGDITCDICKAKYNEGADEAGDYMDRETTRHTRFAGLTVCECCFEKVEDEVENRMPDILKWYAQILLRQREELEQSEALLRNVTPGGTTRYWVPVNDATKEMDWTSVQAAKPAHATQYLTEGWVWQLFSVGHLKGEAWK